MIEERAADEVTTVLGVRVAPAGAERRQLRLRRHPAELVTSIVTEAGVLEPPYEESIARAVGR